MVERDSDIVTWRALTPDHAVALADLIACIERVDDPPYRTSLDEIVELLSNMSKWRGVIGELNETGTYVAFSIITTRFVGVPECVCQGGVHPDFRRRGIGRSLIEWQTRTSTEILRVLAERKELPDDEPVGVRAPHIETGMVTPDSDAIGRIVTHVDMGHEELEEHLRELDYHWSNTYFELRADLESLPQMPELNAYLQVAPWDDMWEDPVRRAANRLADQEWGRPPQSMEQWLMGRTAFAPQWSFVALDRSGDRPQVAGFLLASRYEQDWAALGWSEGYIDQMGVLEKWRNAGVVEALIIASMRAQKDDDMDKTGAGLGSANHSGALAVYDGLGFHVVGESRLYALDV